MRIYQRRSILTKELPSIPQLLRRSTDFGNYTQVRNDNAPANDREIGANTCFTQDESQNGMWGISPTMAQILAISSSQS